MNYHQQLLQLYMIALSASFKAARYLLLQPSPTCQGLKAACNRPNCHVQLPRRRGLHWPVVCCRDDRNAMHSIKQHYLPCQAAAPLDADSSA
jgi:hypothetical protein